MPEDLTVTSMKPLMDWDSNEPYDEQGKVVWWTRFDGRYQVEVHAGPLESEHRGHLLIWDRDRDLQLVHTTPVALSYGAKFGPDVADVSLWKHLVTIFVAREKR